MHVFSKSRLSYWLVKTFCLILLHSWWAPYICAQSKSSLHAAWFPTQIQSTMCRLNTDFFSSNLTFPSQKENEAVYFCESWKKGEQCIEEKTFNIKLDTSNPQYDAYVRTTPGRHLYKLEIDPVHLETGERVWRVEVLTTDDNYSVLSPSRKSGHVIKIEYYFGLLYPVEERNWKKTGYFGVPLSATRVFKIESFYCIIQVKDYKLNPEEWRVLDSIEVEIRFTNTYKLGWRQA